MLFVNAARGKLTSAATRQRNLEFLPCRDVDAQIGGSCFGAIFLHLKSGPIPDRPPFERPLTIRDS